jgi:hypothetical protein
MSRCQECNATIKTMRFDQNYCGAKCRIQAEKNKREANKFRARRSTTLTRQTTPEEDFVVSVATNLTAKGVGWGAAKIMKLFGLKEKAEAFEKALNEAIATELNEARRKYQEALEADRAEHKKKPGQQHHSRVEAEITKAYQVLSLPQGASLEEAKKKVQALAKEYHPDKNPNDPTAVEKMAQFNAAYETLKLHFATNNN